VEGMINICIPHFVIEPILPSLSSRLWFASTNKKPITDEEKASLKAGLGRSTINIKAVVGKSMISVKELLNLQLGDVILLDRKVDEEFEVYVEENLKYKCKPGILKKSIAIKITDVIPEGDENND
jgi:flagellar motor switch protein FliM